MARPEGYPIVLAADRTLMADYAVLFDGMLVASLTTTTPYPLVRGLLMPPARCEDGVRAVTAPCGLRRLEAALLAGGFAPEDVVVVDEAHLRQAIGPATRIVGLSSGEPTGLGMNTNTMTGLLGGRIYPEAMFRALLRKTRRRIAEAAPAAKLVLGGPGAWQISGTPERRRALGIDHVVSGYCEGNIAALFHALLAGEALPEVLQGEMPAAEAIPPLRRAATMGVVEISRGCGLGCQFCTISSVPMQHVPEETILADARTNVAAGKTSIAALSEDFFRYGARGARVNPAAVIHLVQRLRAEVPGLKLIQLDHANVMSVAQYSDAELQQVHDLLVGGHHHDYLWINLGVETASGPLLQRNGGLPKMGGHPVEAWGDLCAEQVRRLCRAGFFPLVSLVVGMPGETVDDVRQTLAWVERLRDLRVTITPVLYAAVDGGARPVLRELSRSHWQLIKAAYETNFRWLPRMYWDNQTGAGVPALKRTVLQGLGLGQVVEMRAVLAWHARGATDPVVTCQTSETGCQSSRR